MRLDILAALLIALVVIFIIGRLWFAIVETVLAGVKRVFRKKEPGAWHTLPEQQESELEGKSQRGSDRPETH